MSDKVGPSVDFKRNVLRCGACKFLYWNLPQKGKRKSMECECTHRMSDGSIGGFIGYDEDVTPPWCPELKANKLV